MTEKPLHVRVAEALGWRRCALELGERRNIGREPLWFGRPPEGSEHIRSEGDEPYYDYVIPSYDTDWSATGPLIEKYGIAVGRMAGDPVRWEATTDCQDEHYWNRMAPKEEGATPLIAVCNLILALAGAGKLKDA